MSRFFVGLALWALLLALAACGGDSKVTDPARDAEVADDSTDSSTESGIADTVVTSFDDSSSSNKASDSSSIAKSQSSSSEVKSSSSSAKSSSSKDDSSSSSDEENSSSSSVVSTDSVASPCKTETEDNCEYGTLTDDRDEQTYKTVKIGEQWWMAENLNYETETGSYCYKGVADNCEKYGRLYTWATAVGKSEEECDSGKICDLGDVKVRGVCPEGWHLPDTTEWNVLFAAVAGKATAGKMLKSTEGWYSYGNGSDLFGFSALPASYRVSSGYYNPLGDDANFWSLTIENGSETNDDSDYAYVMILEYNRDYAKWSRIGKECALSVRCIKD